MQACGVVTVVQEQRFELLGDDGTRRHFTLAHDAPLGWNELIGLQAERCRVCVTHDAARAGHTTAAVHAIARAPARASASQSPALSRTLA
jgi:hypothetical protein